VFPPVLEVKGDGWVIGKSWEGALGSVEYFSVFNTGGMKLLELCRRTRGFIVDDVKVRVGGRAY
jgi:hypothetical protein